MKRDFLKTLVLTPVAALSLAMAFCAPSNAQNMSLSGHHSFTQNLVKGQSWKPGKPYLENVYRQILKYNDYIFVSSLTAQKKGKAVKNGGKFYYKKNNLVRIEVHSKGRNNGAVVVRRKDGVIRGAGGGMLKFMKMNLQHNSRMLVLPNGYNVVDSDYKSLVNGVRTKLKRGSVAKVTAKSVPCYKWSGSVKVVDIKKGAQLTDRILVNTSQSVPVEWNTYKNGKLSSITLFKNFKPNKGLPDKLFKM